MILLILLFLSYGAATPGHTLDSQHTPPTPHPINLLGEKTQPFISQGW